MIAAFLLAAVLQQEVPVHPPRPTIRHGTPTPTPPAGPLKVRSRKERMERYLVASLRHANVDAWLVLTREGTVDPMAFDVAADHAVGRAACIFVDKGDHVESVAIVASYDTDAFEKSGLYTRVVPYGKEGAVPHLKEEIDKLN